MENQTFIAFFQNTPKETIAIFDRLSGKKFGENRKN